MCQDYTVLFHLEEAQTWMMQTDIGSYINLFSLQNDLKSMGVKFESEYSHHA